MDSVEQSARERRSIWFKANCKDFGEKGARGRYSGKIKWRKNTHPLVKEFYRLLNQQKLLFTDVARPAGVARSQISNWRLGHAPPLPALIACLNAIGYDLKIVKIGDEAEAMAVSVDQVEALQNIGAPPGLTRSEKRIYAVLRDAKPRRISEQTIAERVGVAQSSVKVHLTHMRRKGVRIPPMANHGDGYTLE